MSRIGYVVVSTEADGETGLAPEFYGVDEVDEARLSAVYLNESANVLKTGQSFRVAELVELGDET